MDVKDLSKNGAVSEKRMDISSTKPTGGITNVSAADNSPVLMNTPEMKERGFRCDQLVEMAGDDTTNLAGEAPRMTKMKG